MEGFVMALYELIKGMILVEIIFLGITTACSCVSVIKSKIKKEK